MRADKRSKSSLCICKTILKILLNSRSSIYGDHNSSVNWKMIIFIPGNGEIDFEEFLQLMTNTERFLESVSKYNHWCTFIYVIHRLLVLESGSSSLFLPL